jgi:2-polyprenyl-3-methyl-5-hydroxy-6-metoxy-1,4-benzoquinol methylase
MSTIAAIHPEARGETTSKPRVLVAIVSYGTANNQYLLRVVNEYRAMPFHIDIVVVSNQTRDAIPGANVVVVDLEGKHPWSLPFSHRQVLADGLDRYDLFLYSENDHLITEGNIRSFLEVSAVLNEDEIAGFLQFERASDGSRTYPGVHAHFHWDPSSVQVRGEYVFAHFTNEHSGCYILSQRQLKQAIHSGGFLVEPHTGKYGMLESATTDPYTRCGFRKLICISHLDSFLVHHLPNKYADTHLGISEAELRRQVNSLLKMGQSGHRPTSFFASQTKMPGAWYSKSYYEPLRSEVISAIPSNARSVLSIGCGWGELEGWLARKGLRVVAVPLDPVISGAAEARGVEVLNGDFGMVRESLARERFDCLLVLNILHLVQDPVALLRSFQNVLSEGAKVVVQIPNFLRPTTVWRMVTRDPRVEGLGRYETSGVHFSSRLEIRRWLRQSGLASEKTVGIVKPAFHVISRSLLGLADAFLADEFITVAKPVGIRAEFES